MKIAVLGAGISGAKIAELFAINQHQVWLFDYPVEGEDKNTLSREMLGLLDIPEIDAIKPANFQDDLAILFDCAYVIDCTIERYSWKKEIYEKVSTFLNPENIFLCNSSALSINKLAEMLPIEVHGNFIGVHFFNEPATKKIVEIVAHEHTSEETIIKTKKLIASTGNKFVEAKDSPLLIGERIAMFSILSACHQSQKYNIPPDVVDRIISELYSGSNGVFREIDKMGLDLFAKSVKLMIKYLPNDPWHKFFEIPEWINLLIHKGFLGEKTNKGIYDYEKSERRVLDIKLEDYRICQQKTPSKLLDAISGLNYKQKFTKIMNLDLKEAKFLWATYSDTLMYISYHLHEMASAIDDVDEALCLGQAWKVGPFAIAKEFSGPEISKLLLDAVKNKMTLLDVNLPSWVEKI